MAIECLAGFETCLYGQVLPEQGDVLAPWVRITLDNPSVAGEGGSITVGNESFPNSPHTACIKEFEYGKGDGYDIRIVIQDEQGGSFVDFAEALLKDYRCNVSPMNMFVEFGWVKSVCAASASPINSTKIYGFVTGIETNFAGGKFQYEISSKDMLAIGQEGYDDRNIGGDGDEGVYYVDAIRELLTEGPPPRLSSVNWYYVDESGTLQQFGDDEEKFHSPNNDPIEKIKGPKRKWQSCGLDKLDVAYRWTSMVESEDRKKGFILNIDNEKPDVELQIWLDPKPACGERTSARCVATYIVNGGAESSVIEFNPAIKWDFNRLTSGGGNMSTSSTDPTDNEAKTKGRRECPTLSRASNPGAGQTTTGTTENENFQNESGQRGQDEHQRAADHQFRALTLGSGFEADLRIVGDPRLRPILIQSRFVSIIFINPYHLKGPTQSGFSGCPEWLVQPPCNPVLSNDAYIVKSVTHKIQAGKYETVLRVALSHPGIDIDSGEPLGGSQNGWRPPPGCPSSAS